MIILGSSLNRYIFYLVILSFVISKDFDNFFHIELNYSNLANSVYNGETSVDLESDNDLGVKICFSRVDSSSISSGLGIQYIPGINSNVINFSNATNSNLYGLSLHTFLYKSIWSIEIGLESIYHLGSTGKDFIVGPRIGYKFDLFGMYINLNFFIGYINVINFEQYNYENKLLDMSNPVSQIGLSILFPRGKK